MERPIHGQVVLKFLATSVKSLAIMHASFFERFQLALEEIEKKCVEERSEFAGSHNLT